MKQNEEPDMNEATHDQSWQHDVFFWPKSNAALVASPYLTAGPPIGGDQQIHGQVRILQEISMIKHGPRIQSCFHRNWWPDFPLPLPRLLSQTLESGQLWCDVLSWKKQFQT